MRPDLDEYEELNTDLDAEPRGRAMSWIVLGVAVLGFGALAYYAYQSGSQSVADGQMQIVQAEPGPIKEAPADPGGEQFPHKDKTIYDALSPYRTDEQKVETLLPTPEEPVIPEPAVGTAEAKDKGTTSFVNKTTAPTEMETAEATTDEGDDEPKTTPAPLAKPLAAAPAKLETVEVKEAPVATKPAPTPVREAPKPAPVVVKKPEPVKPAPVAATPTGGDYKIQLGAVGSDAEARALWSKVTAKSGDVVKGSPIIVKADVNGKTFYRVRATGFASADAAKKACATLSSRGQACFPAGK